MPQVIIVLGMHRSGTSALAGMLAAGGGDCGDPLLPANEGNPLGYWELAPLNALNDRLLDVAKRRWHDAGPLPAGWQNLRGVRELDGLADELLREQFAHSRFAVLKDPRLCLTMPFWRRAIMQLDWPLSLVAIVRPVGEVVSSLQGRYALGARDIAYLWARSTLETARACFHDRALLVSYDQLLEAPRKVLEEIVTKLGVPVDIESSYRFVNASSRHHSSALPADVPETLAQSCTELYAAMSEAAELRVTLGAAHFRQAEAAMDALDRTLLPQMQQDILWVAREERTLFLREIDAARDNMAILTEEINAARQTINGMAQEIAEAREAHSHRDWIEQQLRARLAEAHGSQNLDTSKSCTDANDKRPTTR